LKSIYTILQSFLLTTSVLIMITSCTDNGTKSPKPRMYPRVNFPDKGTTMYATSGCPFTFPYPSYTKISKDSFIYKGKPSSDCWFDINSKDLNYSLHCSYYPVSSATVLSKLIEEAFEIVDNHNIRANYRKEDLIKNKYGVEGLLFRIEGPVASPLQFYLTDTKKHFFRGSLYFNSKVNADSTAAIFNFIKPEIDSLINNFRWK
jgi:gliding motility-associated lipoprotein GldD